MSEAAADPGQPPQAGWLEALPDPALIFDADLRLLRANAACREQLGVREGPFTVAQTLGTARLADVVEEAATTGRKVTCELVLDGRDLAVTAAPIGADTLLVLRDETDLRRVEAVRRDFVANASHEMKTPVAGIQSLADALETTLQRGEVGRATDLARRLAEEAARLGRLSTELLALRRLEDDALPSFAPVDLVTLVADVLDGVRGRAADRGLQIHEDLPGSAVVVGVEADLRLVVGNLVDNAVGYNRDGGEVRVRLRPLAGAWLLEITDTGIGIPRQDLDRIFERFYRVDPARSRASGGTGLGLSIVRHAVARHGGAVHVESLLGEGSTFAVELPVAAPGHGGSGRGR